MKVGNLCLALHIFNDRRVQAEATITQILEEPTIAPTSSTQADNALQAKLVEIEGKLKMEGLQCDLLTTTFIGDKSKGDKDLRVLKEQIQVLGLAQVVPTAIDPIMIPQRGPKFVLATQENPNLEQEWQENLPTTTTASSSKTPTLIWLDELQLKQQFLETNNKGKRWEM